jgi:CelD/BcsL family acetyltransferase involved in cellulose biosynthesis
MALHKTRWQGRGGSDTFYTSGLVSFQEEFTQLALARGWLRFFVLLLDGKPAASLYAFWYNGVFYFYQAGFDPAYGKYSVGLVTMALAIKAAIEEGAEEYDFLHGDERYKFHWASEVREIGQLEVYPPKVGGYLHEAADQLSSVSRRLARRILPPTLADAIRRLKRRVARD